MPDTLDMDALARDLLVALRGGRSTREMSEAMGYRTNVVYRWETGRRGLPAHEVLGLAHREGRDLGAAVLAAADSAVPALREHAPGSPGWVTALVAELARGRAPGDEAALGMSRFALRRLIIGEATVGMADLLRICEHFRGRALFFVAALVDPGVLPSARAAWASVVQARALTSDTPFLAELLALLRIRPYQALPAHDTAWLARRLDEPPARVDAALDALVGAGFLARGTHYTVAREFRPAEPDGPARARAHALRRADALRAGLPDGRAKMFSYLAFTSQDALARIWDQLTDALVASTELADPSEAPERVYYAMVAVASVDGAPVVPGDAG